MSANVREPLRSEGPATVGSTSEPRVSLWTVPAKWGGAFFVLLVGQGGALIGLHAWRAITGAPSAHVADTVLSEVLVGTPMLVFAGILSMIELEAALTLSVWYQDRVRRRRQAEYEAALAEGELRGWEKGIEEGRRLERERRERLLAARSRTRSRRYPI